MRVVLAYGLVAVAAFCVGRIYPLVSPLLVALGIGLVLANVRLRGGPISAVDPRLTKLVLRYGIVLLGLRLPLSALRDIGFPGIVTVLAVVSLTFGTTWWMGKRLGLDGGLVVLIGAGFSICGAAAVAAVEGGIRRKPSDIATAIAMVTVFGTLMIGLVPLVSKLLGLSDLQTGVWAGASIHEVAQVVAAASVAGPSAVAVASTIKLARVAMLAAVFVVSQRLAGDSEGVRPPLIPWFLWGFLLCAVVRSIGVVPADGLAALNHTTTLLLAAAMFGLGMTVTTGMLRSVEKRVLLLATWSTAVAAMVGLVSTLILF